MTHSKRLAPGMLLLTLLCAFSFGAIVRLAFADDNHDFGNYTECQATSHTRFSPWFNQHVHEEGLTKRLVAWRRAANRTGAQSSWRRRRANAPRPWHRRVTSHA